jgi:hypothetical protein
MAVTCRRIFNRIGAQRPRFWEVGSASIIDGRQRRMLALRRKAPSAKTNQLDVDLIQEALAALRRIANVIRW